MVFIITEEERPVTRELTLIMGKKIIKVYRAENDRELRLFVNGVLCTSMYGVIVLRHIDLWDLVYYIDEVLFCNAISYPEFSKKFTATGRQNTAIKTIFKDQHFEEIKPYDNRNKKRLN